MRILQVEDEAARARAVEQALQAAGHECRTTSLGQEAVELARVDGYDVILLGVALPDIDGYEVLRRLHAAQIRTPVILRPGGTDAPSQVDQGGAPYLVRPAPGPDLSACLAAIGEAPAPTAEGTAAAAGPLPGAEADPKLRRRQPRQRTLKKGQIIYNNASCVADCTILNVSESGAALQADFFDYPPSFTLKIKDGPSYFCEVRWRRGQKLGVRFLKA